MPDSDHKLSLVATVFVAVAAACATSLVASFVLRPSERTPIASTGAPVTTPDATPPPGLAPERAALPSADAAARLDALEDRLATLTERVDALRDERAASVRLPVDEARNDADDSEGLRALILETIASEREAREREARASEQAEELAQKEFELRMYLSSQDVVLPDWQVERLVDLVLEHDERRNSITAGLDPASSSPEEAEAELEALEAELRTELEREFGPALVRKLMGD